MADTNKKPAEKPATKKAKVIADELARLRGMDSGQLAKELDSAKADLAKTTNMLRTGQLPGSHVIKQTKSRIARIHTVIREQAINNKVNQEDK